MNTFNEQLKIKMDEYVHLVYKISRSFPKEELYGATSQIRRATLSIILNYIEGFARKKKAVKQNFWEISYGSLKESKYLLYFSLKERYLDQKITMTRICWPRKLEQCFGVLSSRSNRREGVLICLYA